MNKFSRRLGIVSNSWKTQLDHGQSLEELIARAEQQGYRAIELRQGCLGEFESVVIDANLATSAQARLARLCDRFREIDFNLAVAIPWFDPNFHENDQKILDAFAAASALAPHGRPHLRIVDTTTRTPDPDEPIIAKAANLIANLTTRLIDAGGGLSIEHAYQSWPVFWSAILQARQHLGSNSHSLRCCFDPCNLLLTERPSSVAAIVDGITPTDVSMIHLKQRRAEQIQPDVSHGDLDWPRLRRGLEARGHQGPWLFEVAPHENVWENLQQSIEFLFE